MNHLLPADLQNWLPKFLLLLIVALYLAAAALKPSIIANSGKGRLASGRFVAIWASLTGCLYSGSLAMLPPIPDEPRNVLAFVFGFSAALIIIYRIEEGSRNLCDR